MTSMSNIIGQTGQNAQYLLWKLPKFPFDYTYLMSLLRDFASPRDKISRMIKKKELLQVKKGLYVLSPDFGGDLNLKVLSNLIYGPSYISLEYALSYWGLIPEKVETVTSMTNKRNKAFETPVGMFTYKYLKNSCFSLGVDWVSDPAGSFFIATREKALCDHIALLKELGTGDVEHFLEYDMRVDMDELETFDLELVEEIGAAYRKKSVTAFAQWLRSHRGKES